MPLNNRLKALSEIDETKVYENARAAVAEEFLQPDLPKARFVADTNNLNSDLQRAVDRFKPEERAEKDIALRKALIDYAPEHIDFTFRLPESELFIGPRIDAIDRIIGNRNRTSDIVSVAGGVIDQIIEREMEKVLAEKKRSDDPGHPQGPQTH